jgi:hypothetical protein
MPASARLDACRVTCIWLAHRTAKQWLRGASQWGAIPNETFPHPGGGNFRTHAGAANPAAVKQPLQSAGGAAQHAGEKRKPLPQLREDDLLPPAKRKTAPAAARVSSAPAAPKQGNPLHTAPAARSARPLSSQPHDKHQRAALPASQPAERAAGPAQQAGSPKHKAVPGVPAAPPQPKQQTSPHRTAPPAGDGRPPSRQPTDKRQQTVLSASQPAEQAAAPAQGAGDPTHKPVQSGPGVPTAPAQPELQRPPHTAPVAKPPSSQPTDKHQQETLPASQPAQQAAGPAQQAAGPAQQAGDPAPEPRTSPRVKSASSLPAVQAAAPRQRAAKAPDAQASRPSDQAPSHKQQSTNQQQPAAGGDPRSIPAAPAEHPRRELHKGQQPAGSALQQQRRPTAAAQQRQQHGATTASGTTPATARQQAPRPDVKPKAQPGSKSAALDALKRCVCNTSGHSCWDRWHTPWLIAVVLSLLRQHSVLNLRHACLQAPEACRAAANSGNRGSTCASPQGQRIHHSEDVGALNSSMHITLVSASCATPEACAPSRCNRYWCLPPAERWQTADPGTWTSAMATWCAWTTLAPSLPGACWTKPFAPSTQACGCAHPLSRCNMCTPPETVCLAEMEKYSSSPTLSVCNMCKCKTLIKCLMGPGGALCGHPAGQGGGRRRHRARRLGVPGVSQRP